MFLRSAFLLKGLIALIILILFFYHSVSFDRIDNALQPLGFSLSKTKFCAPIDTYSLHDIAQTNTFASEITYWKRYIQSDSSLSFLPSFTTVNETLLPESAGLQIQSASLNGSRLKTSCLPPLNLPVTNSPPSGETDLTPLILGISTTIGRLRSNTIQHFQRFLTRPISPDRITRGSNNAGFVVHLHNCTDEELEEGYTLLRDAGIDAVVKHSELSESMSERYLSLIPSLLEQSNIDFQNGKKRTWIVLMDDDTFFPRPDALVKTLEEMFPRADEEELYVGGYREVLPDRSPEYTQLQGGAAIFLTIPMVHVLTELHDIPDKLLYIESNKIPAHRLEAKKASYLDMCLEEFRSQYDGDVRLSQCIRDHTDIKSINVPGLHQMDIFGDLSGFYESGGPFLSTHHWKSWNWFLPNRQSAVGDICGEDCVFQRWVFPNTQEEEGSLSTSHPKTDEVEKEATWPMVLSNGFSLAEYEPDTFRKMDLEMAENTFNEFFRPLEEMDYGIGNGKEMREKVAEGMKRQWLLLEAKNSVENEAWRSQWYGLRNEQGDIEKIAELVWVR